MPRDPDEVPVMIQGFFTSNVEGTWIISVTFWAPEPSSLKTRLSSPAIFPSPSVELPAASTLGP